ncbi:MAG: methyltransferase domain-containing protein [Deltaproteobacteria bacterium]|nr:methyltransferase domain-containing protein [Deltaproteobacteria bacterium]
MSESKESLGARIARISGGFQEARVLLLGAELGIYQHLSGGPCSGDELADALGLQARGVVIICDALVAMELLYKGGKCYTIAEGVEALLVPGQPHSMAHIAGHRAHMFQTWAKLDEVVRHGQKTSERDKSPLHDPVANRNFILGMAEVSRGRLGPILDALPLSTAKRFVDLGGGPAQYLCEAARRFPQLEGVLVDLPLTVEVAREVIAKEGLQDRVSTVVCDFYQEPEVPLEGMADVVLISQVFHAEGPEQNRALLQKIAPHVTQGGWVAVVENVVEEGRTQPAGAALFAVNMLAGTERGNTYTAAEIASWLDEAGFSPDPVREVGERAWLTLAQRR